MDNQQDKPKPVVGLRDPEVSRTHVSSPDRKVAGDQLLAGRSLTGSALSFRQNIEACVDLPGFQRIAESLPHSHKATGPGRPSEYPAEMILLVEMLSAARGSQTEAFAELREPMHWNHICFLFKDRFGLTLPLLPLTRRTMQSWCTTYLSDDLEPGEGLGASVAALAAAVRPAFRAGALELARLIGQLRPIGDPDFDLVSLAHLIAGDGTWVRPWSEAQIIAHLATAAGANGEVGEEAWIEVIGSTATDLDQVRAGTGIKRFTKDEAGIVARGYVGFNTRTDVAGERVVLDIAPMPDHSGEITTARAVAADIINDAQGGVLAVAYDMAFVGHDVAALMRLGALPVIKVKAAPSKTVKITVPPELERLIAADRKRDERDVPPPSVKNCSANRLKAVSHRSETGAECEHVLYSYDGDVVEAAETTKTPRARWLCPLAGRTRYGSPGDYRFTLTVEVPCPHGTFTATVEPQSRYYNGDNRLVPVSATLRAVAYSHDDYRRALARRNDIESTWSWMKSQMTNRRSPRLQHGPEYFHILAIAAMNNARVHFWFNQGRAAVAAGTGH